MPQMSPMPWIFILVLTLIILMTMNSLIFFFCHKPIYSQSKKTFSNFQIKW